MDRFLLHARSAQAVFNRLLLAYLFITAAQRFVEAMHILQIQLTALRSFNNEAHF